MGPDKLTFLYGNRRVFHRYIIELHGLFSIATLNYRRVNASVSISIGSMVLVYMLT